jgi:hypothetical protein
MLVSKYISEKLDEKRRIARACNIATYIKENYAKLEGESISAKEIRKQIRFKLDPALRFAVDSRSEEEINGDHRAHGDAWGKSGLKLSFVNQNGVKKIEFSLPNLKLCASYLLGKGPKVGAIKLKASAKNNIVDDKLISQAVKVDVDKLTDWEKVFVRSLDEKWRGRGLSNRQRNRLVKIIKERSK